MSDLRLDHERAYRLVALLSQVQDLDARITESEEARDAAMQRLLETAGLSGTPVAGYTSPGHRDRLSRSDAEQWVAQVVGAICRTLPSRALPDTTSGDAQAWAEQAGPAVGQSLDGGAF